MLTEKGEGANIQNETGVDERSEAEGLAGTPGAAGGEKSPVSRGGELHEDGANKTTFYDNVSVRQTQGIEDSHDRVAAGHQAAPLSRQEKKRRRREMERRELDRRRGGT